MTNNLSQIEVSTYKGIKNLKLDNLGKINIITGNNNSGKTSFLEAIMMLAKPSDLYDIIKVAKLREAGKLTVGLSHRTRLDNYQLFLYLFNKQEEQLLLEIKGRFNEEETQLIIKGEKQYELINELMLNDFINSTNSPLRRSRLKELLTLDEEIEIFVGKHIYSLIENENSLEIVKNENDLYFNKFTIDNYLRNSFSGKNSNYHYISSIDHITRDHLNLIIKDPKLKKDVIDVLKIFDEDIEDLTIMPEDERYIHTIISKRNGQLPISMYGDGIKKIIALAAGIVRANNGILLVDEIETSVHKKAMPRVYHWLIETCNKFNVQMYMTTHSIEVVDEILNSNDEAIKNDWLRVITLNKKNGNTFARVLTGKDALKLRDNFDMELRQ